MAPMAVEDKCEISDDKENNTEENNQQITTTSLLDASKGGICASLYKEKFDSKKILMAMAYGIKLGDQNIGNCDVEPYASAKGKTSFYLPVPSLLTRYCVDVYHRK
jgi:hypothetical protein